VLVRCLPSWLSGFSVTDWLPAALRVDVSGGTLAGTAKLFLDCLARCLRRAGRTTDDDVMKLFTHYINDSVLHQATVTVF